MSRLVTFGCSCTYGNGLDDCLTINTVIHPEPSRLAWPELVSKKLDIPCVNNGYTGISNKQIWKNIITFDYEIGDIVAVMWTNIERYTVFNEDESKTKQIGVWREDPLSKWYYKMYYNEYDHIVDSNLRIAHSTDFLDKLNIPSYHMFINPIDDCFVPKTANILNIPPFAEFSKPYGLAPDNNHPSKDAHKHYADMIYEELK